MRSTCLISCFLAVSMSGTAWPAIAVAAPAAATTPKVPPTQFTQRSLKNGLKVIAIRDTSTPNVMVSMWYEVGSKHDPAGRSGFAHLFEHILSRKTVNMPYNAINGMVDDIGGTRNASTWYDRTNYYEIVPAEYLERMLWTHAERMARPVVDKEVFETERGVVKEELRQRVLAPPYGRFFNFAIGENIFNVLPHRRPTIGSIQDLDNATLEDARAFHQAFYGPDTATLIVSGNFKPAELNALIDRYFANIPRRARAIPLAIRTKDTPVKPRTVTATGPNVPLPLVGSAFRLPAAAHPDMAALEVLDAILSAGDNNRLDAALVKPGLTTEAGTGLYTIEEQSVLSVYGFVAGGKDQAVVATELDKALARLRTTPPTAAEVMEAKNELLAGSLAERETFSGRAFELGEAYVRTGDPRHADKRLAAIARVTPADVLRVAKTYLSPAKRIQLRYVKGDGDPKGWANPTPLPKFSTPPAATGKPNQLRAEADRDPLPGPGERVAYVAPQVTDERLGNGIRFISARTGNVPLTTMTVLIGAGSATDPRAKAGLANLAAAIASKGTATQSADQIAARLERLGASLSASAATDGTYISLTAPAATLGQASEVLSDIVRNASFPEEDFARERKRALDGLSISLKEPGALAGMLVNPVVYGNAPYGSIGGGTPASLAGLTRGDLLAFRQAWWRPELTTVLVSGGIDAAEARKIAESAFGDWKVAGSAPAQPQALAGSALPARTLVVNLPGSGQAAVYAVARGLSRADRAYYDALLANSVLGGTSTGRLFEEIRVKRALSYGAYSGLSAQRDVGTLVASAQTKNESAAEVAKIFLDELQRIGAQPLDAKQVENRKTLLTGSYQRSMQTSAGFNGQVASALLRGLEPTEVLAYPDRVAAVTGAGATASMAQIVKPENISIVIVGDAAKFIDKLRAIRPNVELVEADQLDLATASARK
ncbi:insulinase family protein [Sphingomonas sinipercae]|uniref:Insulinase family protein n=1 Tax=Sphingomonas sinipercae TaxID=2714944 RepID=A0A6G7ZPY5_9SPHN|nr:pitrilysin family protein [Sphingomonas sinipercae]QIL02982.1 insulinase family protein [Sphingomonas sinipercae]